VNDGRTGREQGRSTKHTSAAMVPSTSSRPRALGARSCCDRKWNARVLDQRDRRRRPAARRARRVARHQLGSRLDGGGVVGAVGQRRVVCTCAARGLLRARLSRTDAQLVQQRIAAAGALGPPAGLGLLLAAPTIAAHGTREQIDAYVRDIVTGQRAWCQLFSEPSAGSDLAGIQTRAVADGESGWSMGRRCGRRVASMRTTGCCSLRTDADVPKHQGISYFAFRCTRAASRFARCAR